MGVNSIGAEGAKAIAAKLLHCPHLEKLDLHHNSITDEAARAVLSSWKHCVKLKTLNLFDNNISDRLASTIKGKEEVTFFHLTFVSNVCAHCRLCDSKKYDTHA